MVKVACKVVNGVMLQKWKRGFDDGTGDGEAPTVKDGLAFRLRGPSALHTGAGNTSGADLDPVINDVPDDFRFADWLKQHEKSQFVADGFIYEVKDEENPAVPNER